ncbi:MAG: hypothetical protein AAF690_06000 [Acidobacteriota bacterium]
MTDLENTTRTAALRRARSIGAATPMDKAVVMSVQVMTLESARRG